LDFSNNPNPYSIQPGCGIHCLSREDEIFPDYHADEPEVAAYFSQDPNIYWSQELMAPL
jgi:hypothetical protein